jgi:hypothetical protein
MVYGQDPPDQFEKARQAFDEEARSGSSLTHMSIDRFADV